METQPQAWTPEETLAPATPDGGERAGRAFGTSPFLGGNAIVCLPLEVLGQTHTGPEVFQAIGFFNK